MSANIGFPSIFWILCSIISSTGLTSAPDTGLKIFEFCLKIYRLIIKLVNHFFFVFSYFLLFSIVSLHTQFYLFCSFLGEGSYPGVIDLFGGRGGLIEFRSSWLVVALSPLPWHTLTMKTCLPLWRKLTWSILRKLSTFSWNSLR